MLTCKKGNFFTTVLCRSTSQEPAYGRNVVWDACVLHASPGTGCPHVQFLGQILLLWRAGSACCLPGLMLCGSTQIKSGFQDVKYATKREGVARTDVVVMHCIHGAIIA